MRFKLPAIAFVGLALPLGAMAALSACGSTTDVSDAGKDATTNDVAMLDQSTNDVAVDAGCTNDANLTTLIPSADAAIDVDSGAIALGACIGCLENKCGTDINACNADCACRQGVLDVVTCVAQGTDFQTCGEQALFGGNANLTALFGCAYQQCLTICTGGDGGLPKDAGGDGD